jgi:hypothetical protein
MKQNFRIVRAVLEKLAAQTPAEREASVYGRDHGASRTAPLEFEHLVGLYDNGFLQATDTGDASGGELRSPTLTADGRDLLDALRNDATWARVERLAAAQDTPLSLENAKAIVAALQTGGFNS